MPHPTSTEFARLETLVRAKLEKELSIELAYHGIHHMEDVLKAVLEIADFEGVDEHDTILLKTAAWLHDIGYIQSHENHEEKSCEVARKILPDFGFSGADIQAICGMIQATKIPQNPSNLLEEILCDADLDYLGRDDYGSISLTLFHEMNHRNPMSEQEWLKIQIDFLKQHTFHTQTARRLREERKMQTLQTLETQYNQFFK